MPLELVLQGFPQRSGPSRRLEPASAFHRAIPASDEACRLDEPSQAHPAPAPRRHGAYERWLLGWDIRRGGGDGQSVEWFFDTIPHVPLMKSVARRISDARMLHLIKMWLKAPVEEIDRSGRSHMSCGKKSKCGTPQGGVLSPLLANLYMHRFIQAFRKYGLDRRYGAVLVVYADDFVVLCQRNASEALEEIRRILQKIGLTINETKTSVKWARADAFDFLGHTFKMLRSYKTGVAYPGVVSSKKAVMRLNDRVRRWLSPSDLLPLATVVSTLNRVLRGWAAYFRYGSVLAQRIKLDRFVYTRIRRFLVRRRKVRTAGTRRFPWQYVFGELGVVSMAALPRSST